MPASQVLRLHVWGSSPTLPTLDPTSLYAATLLLATFGSSNDDVVVQLTSASTSISTQVPLLQVLEVADGASTSTSSPALKTVQLLDDIEAIRGFCVAAGLDAEHAQLPEKAARTLALHALLDDQMQDLTLHSLFSLPSNYRTVTAPAYASIGSSMPLDAANTWSLPFTGSPIPSRLRNAVQQRLTAVGLWGMGGTDSAAHVEESNDLAHRAGLVNSTKSKLNFGQSARDAAKDGFEKTKLTRKFKDLLAILESCTTLSVADQTLLGASTVTSLDAHVFSLLAPLLYSTPDLPVQVVSRATMAKSFPKLLANLDSIRDRFWSADRSNWPSWASAEEVSASPASMISTQASTSWWSFSNLIPNSQSTEPQPQTAQKASTPQQPPSKRARSSAQASSEDSRLRWGRILWITSAIFGLVGYAFASGLVSVEWVDPEAASAEVEEEGIDEDDHDDPVDLDETPLLQDPADEEDEEIWEQQLAEDLENVDDDDNEDDFEDDDD